VGSGISASRGYELVALQQQAEQKEQENERLKIEIAKLKSPDRIKAIAKDQLGMEVPRQTYFSSEK
jgi:cell division protein FtsL